MTNELRERTEDWVMQAYIQDDPTYACQHEVVYNSGKGGQWCMQCDTIIRNDDCSHGVYKLAKPRQIICSLCKAVVINTQEMDSISDWMTSLCRGA